MASCRKPFFRFSTLGKENPILQSVCFIICKFCVHAKESLLLIKNKVYFLIETEVKEEKNAGSNLVYIFFNNFMNFS